MSQQELLKTVTDVLGHLRVSYMVTGSVVSSLQGEPRSTHDIDLVVALLPSAAARLAEAFPTPAYYIDVQSIRAAIRDGGMFNLLHVPSGDKVDFWLLTDEPYDRERFARRYEESTAWGLRMFVTTPEDTIVMKLRWGQMSGGSEKQFTDALRVFEIQQNVLDRTYIEKWVSQLGLTPLWNRLLAEAGPSLS